MHCKDYKMSEEIICKKCNSKIDIQEWIKNYKVCPKCNYHSYISAFERLNLLADEGSFVEYDAELYSVNPLGFPKYETAIKKAYEKTGLRSEMLSGEISIGGNRTAICIGDAGFIMGSMGSVVGEKITRCIERAIEKRLPLIIVSAYGGGARMYEGTIALMQMAKTAAACAKYKEEGLFYISVLTDPTMGGTAASFASLGHIIIAEPGARIGFAGYRARASIKEKLPENYQTAEFLLEHGTIDSIVQRKDLRSTLIDLLDFAFA